jgi:DNA-binding SARP family transcriptional activator
MLRDGKPVPSSEWRAIAARELFLYLLFVGPQSREQISLEFWPDSSTKRVRSNFHTTLYRARQALGENVITFKDDVYLIDPELDVWCDAQELESLAVQARLLSPRDVRTEDLWRRAVSLYRGDFLPSLDAEWVATRRETLREIHLEALIGLGECARARGDFREALGVFRRALGLEPYREDIHRSIMTCYAERGEKQKVLLHLRELQRLFRQELAAEPSLETLALAETLLN